MGSYKGIDTEKTVAAIIMASGFSRRMGANKLMLPLDGRTVIEHVMDQVGLPGYDPVIVVSQYDRILLWAGERGYCPVKNHHAEEGKSNSIRLGVSELEARIAKGECLSATGMAFFTGDQILLSNRLLLELREAFLAQPEKIVFPVYDGKPGSPAIFPTDMIPCFMKLEGEEGGMRVAREHENRIVFIAAVPGWQGMDFDTVEDWEKVRTLRAAQG